MAESKEQALSVPGGSWERIQKIIRAYRAADDEEDPTVDSIARLAGMQRPLVSMNNKFLRGIGLLQEDRNKLTRLGVELATGLEIGSREMVSEALRHALTESATVTPLINILRARGPMSIESFKGQIRILANIKAESPAVQWIKSFLDIMQESELIQINDDGVSIRVSESPSFRPPASSSSSISSSPSPSASPSPSPSSSECANGERNGERMLFRTPIALGPDRLAYIELPTDWNCKKDLGKLLKLIQLSLGDDIED